MKTYTMNVTSRQLATIHGYLEILYSTILSGALERVEEGEDATSAHRTVYAASFDLFPLRAVVYYYYLQTRGTESEIELLFEDSEYKLLMEAVALDQKLIGDVEDPDPVFQEFKRSWPGAKKAIQAGVLEEYSDHVAPFNGPTQTHMN